MEVAQAPVRMVRVAVVETGMAILAKVAVAMAVVGVVAAATGVGGSVVEALDVVVAMVAAERVAAGNRGVVMAEVLGGTAADIGRIGTPKSSAGRKSRSRCSSCNND